MRVLVAIFEKLIPISGGGTPRISNVVRAFVARGHEVYVAAPIGVGKEEAKRLLGCADWLPIQGVNRLDRWKMPKYLVAFPLNIVRVANYARKLKPDLVVSHNSIAGYSGLLAKRFEPKTLTVLDLTDLLFEYLEDYRSRWLKAIMLPGRALERRTIGGSDRIITISQSMKDIASRFGAQLAKIDVVPDGVDTTIFRPVDGQPLRERYAPGAKYVVIFHGVIDPQDGPELMVDGARLVVEREPATSFWLVGDGAAVPALKERVRRYRLEERFYFSGWVAQGEVAHYISASDLGLVILPDVLSARGRVTLKEFEYWACGVPAVLPRLPALQEVTKEGEAAVFYRPGDHEDLAEKICHLLVDEDRRREMGSRGEKMVKEQFEWRDLADRFVRSCEGYLGRGGGDEGSS